MLIRVGEIDVDDLSLLIDADRHSYKVNTYLISCDNLALY